MQLTSLFKEFDTLQDIYGDIKLKSIYGAGEIKSPNICLIFMNPTARNVASYPTWKGLRAPWLGTKNIWKLFYKLGLFNNSKLIEEIERLKSEEWTYDFSAQVYTNEEYEYLKLDDSNKFKVYPSYYPVGQGMRNISKAITRIKKVLDILSQNHN